MNEMIIATTTWKYQQQISTKPTAMRLNTSFVFEK